MRITIIPSENKISIDGEPIVECDVSWIPEFVGDITGVSQKVHAVQWYDDHGEIELVTRDANIPITELGIFEQAIIKYEERKVEQEAAKSFAEALRAEEELAAEALRAAEEELLYTVEDMDIDKLLAEL